MINFKKLIFSPRNFFNDSLWFKKESLNIDKDYNNVFIISHLGQLQQVESLIKYENIKDCLLVILYTKKNIKVPNSLQKQYNKTLFKQVLFFLLPASPNNYKIKSLLFMKRNYEELIHLTKPKTIYVLSFENHYALIATSVKRQDINLVLIDEGTATYKTPNLSEYHQEHLFFKKNIAKLFGIDAAFNWFTNFDSIYAAFPELLKSTFKANEYHRFFAHAGKTNIDKNTLELIETYKITSNDFIYVNQRYAIDDNDFTNAILEILNQVSKYYNAKIFIKMHPKDRDSLKHIFSKKIKNFKNIILIKENEFLIEPAIQAIKPRGVLGLTSTSLVYTPFVSASTQVYSIKPWFINLIPNNGNEEGIAIINDHYSILRLFNHVVHLNSENDLREYNIHSSSDNISSSSVETYLIDAKEAYKNKKYYKSLINFEWAYPNGIEIMPIEEFIMYLDSIRREQKIEQVQYIINRWIEAEILNHNENSLEDYFKLIELISNILINNYEYIESIYIKIIYIDLMALITQKMKNENCLINLEDIECSLAEDNKEEINFLLSLKVKQYLLNFEYEKALNLINKIFEHNSYIQKNQSLYLDLLECLIYFKNNKEIDILRTKITDKTICQLFEAKYLSYTNQYESSLEILLSLEDKLIIEEKRTFKIELSISKIYTKFGNYRTAKCYLISFKKYSKGSGFLFNREMVNLEYQFNNYKKVIYKMNKAYLNTTRDIPKSYFTIYIECLYKDSQYCKLYDIKQNHTFCIVSQYYYLLTLEKLFKYKEFLKELKDIEITQLEVEKQENLFFLKLKVLRELGEVKEAYSLMENNYYNTDKLENLLICVDIMELNDNFKTASEIWKIILLKYNKEKPSDAWDRYYATLNLMKDLE